ncbi:MAG: CinA family protein [Litorimonas sp.]
MTKNLLSEIFGLSAELVASARSKNKTLATAESCTGGLIGAAITATAGSSSVFHGGIIAYHNDIKISQLGVDPTTLNTQGAVSETVAMQMAKGCRDRLGVDIAVSVTGIAGPGGGSKDKPVGTVWVGVATENSVTAKLYNFSDMSRNKVRDYTCLEALQTLLRALN